MLRPPASGDQARGAVRVSQVARRSDSPRLHFKRVHRKQNVYSVRIADGWRALGIRDRDRIAWFWIGAHDEYERLLSNL